MRLSCHMSPAASSWLVGGALAFRPNFSLAHTFAPIFACSVFLTCACAEPVEILAILVGGGARALKHRAGQGRAGRPPDR